MQPRQWDPTAAKKKRSAFSEALIRERARMQYSRRTLADHCGVSQSVIERWEDGEAVPSVQQFKRLYNLRGLFRLTKSPPEWGIFSEAVLDGRFAKANEDHQQVLDEVGAELDRAEPRPPAQTFHEGLKRVREENGLTRHQLGEIIMVTESAVAAWEREENIPIQEHMDKLLQVFPELEAAIAVGAIKLPVSRDMLKPGRRAATIDGALEIAMQQSEAEKHRAEPQPKPRWADTDWPGRNDREDEVPVEPPLPPPQPAVVEVVKLVEAPRSTIAELAEAYGLARVTKLKADRAKAAAYEAYVNAETEARNAADAEREALELLDLAVADEANK